MNNRRLGHSGLMVPELTLGTGTFGGGNAFFKAWGATDVKEASRLIDICLDAGLTMFDSADVYSGGMAEEILGAALKGRRDKALISTKATFAFGAGANEVGSSRHWLIKAVDASLTAQRKSFAVLEAAPSKPFCLACVRSIMIKIRCPVMLIVKM